MAEETVLISVKLEKQDNEKEVDNLTKSIVNLQKATADLKKQNNDLIKSGKENTEEFANNTRQIEINKQKINEQTSSRKNLITTIINEDDSLKGLRARNAELIKQRDQISTATKQGRNEIAALNDQIDENNETIEKNVDALGKQKINIGNYKSALDGIVPGLGGFIDGIQGATKAGLAFIATPIGLVLAAIALALAAVSAYFKGSEEGQNKLNKAVAIGSAIFEQFMNVVEGLGEAIVAAFENPKQAAADLWEFIKQNLVNRFVGFIEFLPQVGKAIEQAFSGDFAGALKTTADAAGKVFLGVENITDKVIALGEETARLVQQGIENGQKIAALNAKIDRDERDLIVNRAKTALDVAKLREAALQQEGEARKKVLLDAIALEEQLTQKEVGLAKQRRDLAQAELEANGDDKEAKKAVAEAQAALINAEATAFQNTLRFRKEIAAIDEAIRKAREEAIKKEIAAQDQLSQIQIQREIDQATTIEARTAKEVELERVKAEQLIATGKFTATEQEVIKQQSQDKINEIVTNGNAKIIEEELKLKEVRIQASADATQAIIAGKEAELQKEIDANGLTVELITQQTELRKQAIDTRVQAELDSENNRVAGLLANTLLLEEEKAVIVEQSAAKTNAILAKAAADRAKVEIDTEKRIAAEKKKLQDENIKGAFGVADAAVGAAKAAFGENKKIAIAEAIINTIKGVARAFSDYVFPYSLIVAALTGAAGFAQVDKIKNTTFFLGGLLKMFARGGLLGIEKISRFMSGGMIRGGRFAHGGIARTGGVLRGPLHRDGGIPFTVNGRSGFEAEGGEAIINKRSTAMFRGQLSRINQAGGGVAFATGGVTGTQQTQQAGTLADNRAAFQDAVKSVMDSLPPILVTVEDINARQQEYNTNTQKAEIIS